jgi:hypothetical protein
MLFLDIMTVFTGRYLARHPAHVNTKSRRFRSPGGGFHSGDASIGGCFRGAARRMTIRNRGGSDPQAADFIQDVNRFQFPSEDMADEMGEEAAAFICGLI